MAHPVFGKMHGHGKDPIDREERIGEQVMEHVGHGTHMSEHLGKIPNVTGRRGR